MNKLTIVILFSIFAMGDECFKLFKDISSIEKNYFQKKRIVNMHKNRCSIFYGYELFLNNPLEVKKLQESRSYAKRLGKFVKKYPYISRFIFNKDSFELFKYYYTKDKIIINEVIRDVFGENINKKDALYLSFALELNNNIVDKKRLKKRISYLKKNYKPNDFKVLIPFWSYYKEKYKNIYNFEKLIDSFFKTVSIYEISTLEKYALFKEELYPSLLPKEYTNDKYKDIIAYILSQNNNISQDKKVLVIKNSSQEIENSISQWNKENISIFLKPFLSSMFFYKIETFEDFQKDGILLLATDNLKDKLKWLEDDPKSYYNFQRELLNQSNPTKLINLLILYNYTSSLYSEMKTAYQKAMFKRIVNMPTRNYVSNLSLIYTLGNDTNYFKSIIYKPQDMYSNEKYYKMLFVARNGDMVLNRFVKGEKGAFINDIDELVETPYSSLNKLTNKELIEIGFKVLDYASYASTIISGVGIYAQIIKGLGKATIKGVIKKGTTNYLNYKIKYTSNSKLNTKINDSLTKFDNFVDKTERVVTLTNVFYKIFFRDREMDINSIEAVNTSSSDFFY